MAQRNIDFGSFPDDPNADAIRTAFDKVQQNFTELFSGLQEQAVLSVNRTAGSGVTVNSPTGNVIVSANIAHVNIDDVGSGVGYVLPVLSSLSGGGVSLIQQPELHLHPALQSALGTAIIKCVENKTHYNAFTLLETHSEHILLRIMRLLRSSANRIDDVIKPIDFESIAILYFQPQGNGTTIIKRLRLSPDGQFVDRWPGGFFEERYKDIFDA